MTAGFVISCEGDLEHLIKYLTKLAKPPRHVEPAPSPHPTFVEVSFPSEAMLHIFMSNLFKSFIRNKIPQDCGMKLQVTIINANHDAQ